MKHITVIAQDTTSGMACTMQDYKTLAEAESIPEWVPSAPKPSGER